MTTTLTLAEIACALEPNVFARAERVRWAIALLRSGTPRRDVSGQVRVRYSLSKQQAWRVVQVAIDLGGPDGK